MFRPSIPEQGIHAGRLESAWRKEVARLNEANAIARIWRKDPTLWKSDDAHAKVIRNRLGWIDVLDTVPGQLAELRQFAEDVRADGFRDIVLLGMGGSSLAPEVISLLFPPPFQHARFEVVDSTDPASILAVEGGPGATGHGADLRHTLFIVASKSGKTIETLTQTKYFLNAVQSALSGPPGGNFVAITDAGSYLDEMATQQKFRKIFRNPADIGGRYSALSLFGLVPASLWGVDLSAMVDSARAMCDACGPQAPAGESNPALALGALMGVAAQAGCDKMLVLATESLVPLGNWIEQLVAESTGKEGKGVLPVAGDLPAPAESYGPDCFAVVLALEGEERGAIDNLANAFRQRGTPVAEIALQRREDLGAEFFRWEAATAVAGATLGIDPFDEPNVQESKDNTAAILAAPEKTGAMPGGAPVFTEAGIQVFAEGSVRDRIQMKSISGAVQSLMSHAGAQSYLAILSFVNRDDSNGSVLDTLRFRLRDSYRRPVLLGYGPRYLHSVGQFYKGGPPSGVFLVITCADAQDVAIPGHNYGFGQLKMAQALGDLQALAGRQLPHLRLHLEGGAALGLRELEKSLGAS